MTNWIERFGFDFDPYAIVEPEINHIVWNRNDLSDESSVFEFLKRVREGQRVGLKLWGPAGAGKTWLTKYIEKELIADQDTTRLVINSRTPGISSSPFNAFYATFLESYLPHLEDLVDKVNELLSPDATTIGQWQEQLRDRNLGACFWTVKHRPELMAICLNWLEGERLAAAEIRDIGVSSSLNDESKKFSIIRGLCRVAVDYGYESVTLIVDELENANPPSRARAMSEAFRELLDSFARNFSLVACWSVQNIDELYDVGFTEFMLGRMQYTVELEPISPDFASEWLTEANKAFRTIGTWDGPDIAPFTDKAITHLVRSMDITHRFPRYILRNCGVLAATLPDTSDEISEDHIDVINAREELDFMSRGQGMM